MSNRKNNIYITDTSLIANKGGIDKIAYNPQLLKQLKKLCFFNYYVTKNNVFRDETQI